MALDTHDLFPYSTLRKGQKEFMDVVSSSLDKGNHVVVSAPNGFGKTVSTLSAAIPVAIKNDLKLVYLCRTHTQNSRVIQELNAIHAKLVKRGIAPDDALPTIGGVSLRGRNEMCFKPQIKDNSLSPGDASAVCSQLRSDNKCVYFSNLQKLVDRGLDLASISSHGDGNVVVGFDAENINEYATAAKVCPYFYSRELLKNVRVSVGNYQWFFNPIIHDKFLDSIDAAIEDVLLIIDEAHNIPSVAEDLHSLKLTKYSIGVAKKELGDFFHADPEAKDLVLFLKAMEDVFSELERTIGNQDELEFDPRELLERMQFYFSGNFEILVKRLVAKGEEIQKFKLEAGRENPRSFCSVVARFWSDILNVTMDKTAYYHCFSREANGKYSANYAFEAVCLDPGLIGLKSMLDNVYASLSLSGTIVPEAYTAVCRIPANNTILKLGTPFSANQVKTVVLEGVSTSMNTRDSSMYLKYLQKIVEMATATPKNSAAFCASYTVLKGILDAGFESAIKGAGKLPLFEKAGMASSENDDLIAQYKEYSRVSNGSVLLGVTGGRNSEGQDFPGDEMNAVMIVGIPYATPTPRVKKKISYYDSVFENGKGWSLGYEIPAIQKANQACGRPIRTLDDRAVIVLADDRFKREKILRLMSPWLLQDISSVKDSPGFLHASVSRFFKRT